MRETKAPACIGIIMDGNRRWAKARGAPALEGHRAGRQKLEEVIRWARHAGVKHVVAYAFSTENWNRPAAEVSALMELFYSVLQTDVQKLARENIRVRIVGDRSRFSPELQKLMSDTDTLNMVDPVLTLHILLSYGGRAEIVAAANALTAAGTLSANEEAFAAKLWSADMPDPDLIIRTGGEKRLSNFLLWRAAYSELFFLDTLWPDFSKAEFDAILVDFSERERRHGR